MCLFALFFIIEMAEAASFLPVVLVSVLIFFIFSSNVDLYFSLGN